MNRVESQLVTTVRWFLMRRRRAANVLPFYCDPTHVGTFAVEPRELAAGKDSALFKLFVTLSMYQALRDVTIMHQQRLLLRKQMCVVADVSTVSQAISQHACPTLGSTETFENSCDVRKDGDDIDCGTCPGVACQVKDATRVFNRMGDMGKLPTSAWLRLWQGGGMRSLLDEVCKAELSPTKRARLLIAKFAAVHRVGRKLATMFVSALSTPALAPGLTPWFPAIDGNEVAVIDTNVARAVDALRRPGALKTYDARERWVREHAKRIDLRALQADLPRYSPRLVQEALYVFCSKSNRVARADHCAARVAPCAECASALCPFAAAGRTAE